MVRAELVVKKFGEDNKVEKRIKIRGSWISATCQ